MSRPRQRSVYVNALSHGSSPWSCFFLCILLHLKYVSLSWVSSEPVLGDVCCSGRFVYFDINFWFACRHSGIRSTVDCRRLFYMLRLSFEKLLIWQIANKTWTKFNPTQSSLTHPTQRYSVFCIFVWCDLLRLIHIYPGNLVIVIFVGAKQWRWSVFSFRFIDCLPNYVVIIVFWSWEREVTPFWPDTPIAVSWVARPHFYHPSFPTIIPPRFLTTTA